jgi:hypothetical protein
MLPGRRLSETRGGAKGYAGYALAYPVNQVLSVYNNEMRVKWNTDCRSFFYQISISLNIVGVSYKHHGMLRNARLENVKKTLDCDEIESGSGLH